MVRIGDVHFFAAELLVNSRVAVEAQTDWSAPISVANAAPWQLWCLSHRCLDDGTRLRNRERAAWQENVNRLHVFIGGVCVARMNGND